MSTTGFVAGREIERHIGPVSAHFVIGTGVFADVFSAFSDIFGAHSRSYQEKLDRISWEAITLLDAKARRLGADAVIGLRIDHDEISGAGKSMLMVTSSGTAVRLARRRLGDERAELKEGVTPSAVMRRRLERRSLARTVANQSRTLFEEDVWRSIIEHRIAEALAPVISLVESRPGYLSSEEEEKAFDRVVELLVSLDHDEATAVLYETAERAGDLSMRMLVQGAEAADLFSPIRFLELLRSRESFADRARVLPLIKAHPPAYDEEALDELKTLEPAVWEAFPEADTFVGKKGVLRSEAELWECIEGHSVLAREERCSKCGRNRRGFTTKEFSAGNAVWAIRERIAALEDQGHEARGRG